MLPSRRWTLTKRAILNRFNLSLSLFRSHRLSLALSILLSFSISCSHTRFIIFSQSLGRSLSFSSLALSLSCSLLLCIVLSLLLVLSLARAHALSFFLFFVYFFPFFLSLFISLYPFHLLARTLSLSLWWRRQSWACLICVWRSVSISVSLPLFSHPSSLMHTRTHCWTTIIYFCGACREVGGWGRDPKKCTGRDWGMGSSNI